MRIAICIFIISLLSSCYVYKPLEEKEDENRISLSDILEMNKQFTIKSNDKTFAIKPIAWRKGKLITELKTSNGEFNKTFNLKEIEKINNKNVVNGRLKEDSNLSLKEFIKEDKFYKIKVDGTTYRIKLIKWNDDNLISKVKLIGHNKKSFHKNDIKQIDDFTFNNATLNANKDFNIKDFISSKNLYEFKISGKKSKMRFVSWSKDTLVLKQKREIVKVHKKNIQTVDNLPFVNGLLSTKNKIPFKNFFAKNKSYDIKAKDFTYNVSFVEFKKDSVVLIINNVLNYEKVFNKNDIQEVDKKPFINGYLVQEKKETSIKKEVESNKFYKIKAKNKWYKIKTVKWEGDSLVTHVNFKEKNEQKFHKNDIQEINQRIFSRGRSDATTVGIYGGILGLILFLIK